MKLLNALAKSHDALHHVFMGVSFGIIVAVVLAAFHVNPAAFCFLAILTASAVWSGLTLRMRTEVRVHDAFHCDRG